MAVEHSVRPVWIDSSWLSWEYNWDSDSGLPYNTVRPYEVHQHACDRLAGNPDEFDRVDAITTLRRVVSQRVKALKEIYNLRDLPIGAKPRGDLELLSEFGIIRPFMLKRLVDIRNIVEHQDSSPPPTDECLMFADLVWYFLRSTDGLARTWVPRIFFYPPGTDVHSMDRHQIVIEFCQDDIKPDQRPFGKPLEIEICTDPLSPSYEPKAGWMRIDPAEIVRFEDAKPPWVRVRGIVSGTDEQMKLIYELYFRICHFR
jgi:hypothetical protein